MKNWSKKSITFLTIALFTATAIIPISIGNDIKITDYLLPFASDTEQELDLLCGETKFNLTALEDISYPFNISYVVPLNYKDQAPILFEVCEDITTDFVTFLILNDTNSPNKIINFTIAPLTKGMVITIHFRYWVLVKNNDYADLPRYVKMPKEEELPDNTKTWLVSTKNIQSDNILIRLKAKQVKGFTNNLIRLANKVVLTSTGFLHKRIMLIKMINLRNILYPLIREKIESDWIPLQDAFSSLFLRGSCYAQAHLGVALFRANNVPARSIIITPTYGKVTSYEQHVICEYYCPNYGWVPAETTFACTPPKGIIEDIVVKVAHSKGSTNFPIPYETKGYIVLRINYPDDENEAGNGLSYYGGMEAYMKMYPGEVERCLNFSGNYTPQTQGWIEKELTTDQQNADNALSLTQDVYELQTKYIGMTLISENKQHFDNAILAQKNAIDCFNQSDINGYTNNITTAYNEYIQINI